MAASLTSRTFASPVPETARWLDGVTFRADRPLINVAQAAPLAPPPDGMLSAMAEALQDPVTHRYSPDLGRPDLRLALADHWGRLYGGSVAPDQVAITSGANHAFAATIAALCAPGDAVILPTPWYFNHKMWLDMAGVTTLPLPTGADLLPDPDLAQTLITPQTRAIVLVTPNNPAGVEYPPALMHAFYDLAQRAKLKLIVDETYRDFLEKPGRPHDLVTLPDWDATLVQLYSFSKAFHLAGHRVGAVIGAPLIMPDAEKFIDTVTICPTQLGQRAALWGITHLGDWLEQERAAMAQRRAAFRDGFAPLAEVGWQLSGLGGYFAYLAHPFAGDTVDLARKLVHETGILALPGPMFAPDNTPAAAHHLRVAVANTDTATMSELIARLASLRWPLAPSRGAA